MYVEYVNKNAFVEKVMNFLIYKLGDTVAIRVPGAILPHCVGIYDLKEHKWVERYDKKEG